MIYDDYIAYAAEFREKYGEKTVVLIQVGDFFELYGVQNDSETCGADMFAIGDICNLTVTRKNKSILENNRQNPLMAGFPLHALSKHAQLLMDNDYTVVIIRQVTPPPNVRREVTEILSPSTNITPNNSDANWLLAMFWETYPNGIVSVGIAGADVSTGQTFIREIASSPSDPEICYDEIYRIAQSYQPREIVLLGAQNDTAISLLSKFGTLHKRWCSVPKLAYQNEVIRKAYADKTANTMLSPIEILGLDRIESGRFAFIHLIAFLYEHNNLIVKRLEVPTLIQNNNHLILEYNSAVQLNLLASLPNEKPLISILNKCCTAFGSRLFKERLLAPLADPGAINARYDRIHGLIETRSVHLIRKTLKNINDMERAVRRMELGTLSPMEWSSLHSSLQYAKAAAEYDGSARMQTTIAELTAKYTHILSMDECAKYNMHDIKGTIFCEGVYEDIDKIAKTLRNAFAELDDIAQNISILDKNGTDSCLCRVDSNDRDGFFLQITKKRWECAISKGLDAKKYRAKPISSGSSVLRIQNDDIEKLSDMIIYTQRKLATIVLERYREFLEFFVKENGSTLKDIISYIADLDVATNNAFIAENFGYSRPHIDQTQQTSAAFLTAKDIRHPIIERLNTQIEYVKNNVTLDRSGILLYGINASGKSSLMKAIGLNVIMAQAGMYVAASDFTYFPFKHIFTRISSMDNIYRGMSTFVVEMAELRNIIQRCDAYSLVLGDELCAGTESVSAIAIVAAGIDTLVKKRCSFIFATHLHELTDIEFIASSQDISICHMHVETDPETGKIYYDRKLKSGRGNELYGLEVCDTLGMPTEFMAIAHKVRKTIQNVPHDIVADKWSRYNKAVNVDICKVCNKAPAEDTHHIVPQETVDESGFVAQGVRVHRASNLAPLCKKCHMEEHNGDLNIIGYRQTSDGIELHYERKPKQVSTSFETVVADLQNGDNKGKFTYNAQQRQWFQRTTSGSLRRCKIDAIVKYVSKIIKREVTEEEIEILSSL